MMLIPVDVSPPIVHVMRGPPTIRVNNKDVLHQRINSYDKRCFEMVMLAALKRITQSIWCQRHIKQAPAITPVLGSRRK